MLVIMAENNKMIVRIANREDHEQPDHGLHCLSRPFRQATRQLFIHLLYQLENNKELKPWLDCSIGLNKQKISV